MGETAFLPRLRCTDRCRTDLSSTSLFDCAPKEGNLLQRADGRIGCFGFTRSQKRDMGHPGDCSLSANLSYLFINPSILIVSFASTNSCANFALHAPPESNSMYMTP